MKYLALLALCAAALIVGCSKSETAGNETPGTKAPAPAAPATTAPSGGAKLPTSGDVQLAVFENKATEAGCGMCMYHMDGVNRCVTAAMIDGKPMLVSGPHSNAHGLGLCGSKKQVLVSGSVVNGELVATSMKQQ